MLSQSFSRLVQQGISLILVSCGLITLANTFTGASGPLKLLPASTTTTKAANPNISEQVIKTVDELNQAILKAKGKPILVDFYADWCTSCKVIEATVFKAPQVLQKIQDFVILKVDLTSNKESQPLLKQFNVIAPPTFLFFNKEGKELTNLRLVGEVSTDQFLAQLNSTTNSL